MANKLKNRPSIRLFDGQKSVDLWNGDEGWTVTSGDTKDTNLAENYKFIPTMYRAAQLRAYSVSTMPFELTKTGQEEAYDKSSDWQNNVGFMPSPTIMLQLIELALVMCGRAYLFRDRSAAGTKNLRYHIPTSVTEYIDPKTGKIDRFERPVNDVTTKFKPEDYIYFWLPDPYVEVGPPHNYPAQAAANACGVLKGIDLFASGFFDRGAIKAMLLTVKGMPSKTDRTELEDWWKKVIGGIKNAFGAKVVNADAVTPIIIGEGMKELENVTIGSEKREEISIAVGIPASLLFMGAASGLGGGGVASQDELNYLKYTIIPECEFIAGVLNDQLFTPLGLHFNFLPETLDAMQEDTLAQAEVVKAFTDAGIPQLMAIDLAGVELTDEQRGELEKAIADKQARADAMAELAKQNANKPVDTTQPQQGQSVNNQALAQGNREVPAKSLATYDLSKWERKALKRLRESGSADVEFLSDYVCGEDSQRILTGLKLAKTAEDVKAVFRQSLIGDELYQDDFETSMHNYTELVEALRDAAKAARERVEA